MSATAGTVVGMKLLVRWLALVAVLGLLLAPAPQAHADEDQPSSWDIPRYEVTAQLAPDGTARVTLDFDFDFSSDSGHGPFITLPLRQEVLDNPDVWRMLDVDVESVTSRTGANTEVQETVESGVLLVRVGREGRTFTGIQNYVITYRISGLIAPNQARSGLDELNWNAVGSTWQVPIREARVRVEGPSPVSRTACFSGSSFDIPCDHTQDGNTATFAASGLGVGGRGMQVVAGFPAGTFVGAEPRYTKRPNIGNMFPVTPLTAGLTGVLGLLGVGTVIHQVRRRGRDKAYVGLTPGLTPARGQESEIAVAKRQPVTVQFRPPREATPGEIGVLIDARADNRDVTGAIIDLAVRGHFHIDQVDRNTWSFTRTSTQDRLRPFERDIVDRLFRGQRSVTTDDMKDKAYAGLLTNTRTALYQQVAQERRWFNRRPDHAKLAAGVIGVLLILGGLGLGFLLGVALGWGLLGGAFVLTGVLLLALANLMPARTADGSAVLAQAKGFELYLRTAEADQIRFEEGIDVFSRYLPYAIVFGVAERWTKQFEKLAAAGRYEPDTSWYGSPHGTGFFYGASFAQSMDQMTASMSSAMSSAVTASTAATSGGSGFSGGGGFGGGGGGGW
jgi:uncharacterized membrane protein YgcG